MGASLVAVPPAWKMRVTAPEYDAGPNGTAGWIRGAASASERHLCPDLGERVMRMSSSLVAPSTVALMSIVLLCGLSGAAMSQTTPNSTLPTVTVVAPRQVARPPHRPERTANAGAG